MIVKNYFIIKKLCYSFISNSDRLRELAAVVPEAFADGKINWDALCDAIGENLEDETQEHFGIFFPGKREARIIRCAKKYFRAVGIDYRVISDRTVNW